jgi:DNA-binding IclR family transcriptional regulator
MGPSDPVDDSHEAGPTGAQAVDRAVALLRCFDGTPGSISLTELAKRTGLRVSTAHRIIRALVRGELLAQDPLTERYQLGRAVAVLGQAAARGLGLGAVQDDLEALVARTGESASLGVRDGAELVVMVNVESDQPLRFGQPPGTRVPIHASAMGKAILAFADADLRTTIGGLESLPRFTSATITRRPALVDELEHIRREGYAMNLEERYDGVAGVAAPILDERGRSRGAIGIRGPAVRLDVRRIRELAPVVLATAQRVAGYVSLDRL